jgi:excinuclease ABC subunit C
VKGLFARQLFAGFGPSLFTPAGDAPQLYAVEGGRPARLRAAVRQECPRRPGVYGMINESGELIYVGKAKSLRSRLLSYFRPKSRDPKAGRILRDARVVAWEPAHGEFAALLRELELIRRWRPRFNVQGQPHRRRRAYVCVGREPAPYLFLSPRQPGTAFAGFGPVPGGATAREAVRRLNDWFRLRDCPKAQKMVFADQRALVPLDLVAGCLRVEIDACLGPCAAACSRGDYSAAVRAAVRFLEGVDASPLDALQRDMQEASAAQHFERAAALRDRWQPMHWLSGQLERVRQACRRSCVYPAAGHKGARDHWCVIHHGRVRAVTPAPRDDVGRAAAAAALEAVYQHAAAAPPGPHEIDGMLLVASWFRRHPGERDKILSPAAARALCQRRGLSQQF